MDHPVDLVGGDAGCHGRAACSQRLRSDPPGDPHRLDHLGRLDVGVGVGRGAGLPTYSGRGMCAGTRSPGVGVPGTSSARVGMTPL